ncbi:hypothetical protein OS175_02585 [Marinicella sp. S1101]|uniref:hypothetical protein n=1 Tax=Marinicella marina TaxID=2996016 RepID=UPI002260D2CE|nr:hypothetical protein [Marinicella marina]MCX7552753.1 hypothetical protein [Marinicella marina]MDJ1139938.1 hypothetical protein [Marinicella marina]
MKDLIIPVALIFISLAVTAQTELGSEISYQGNLTINGVPVDGSYDFDLYAYDAANGGNELAQFLVDDANVNQGFFSVELDFGDVPFTGNQVWLEIRIREGSSNGGFQQLLPRYKINSSPYAIHAQFVGADAVGNSEIQDGSITTTKLANDAVNTAKIIDGEVSNSDLADGAVNSIKISDGSINNIDLANGAVTTDSILDATITSADLADGEVGAAQINIAEVQQRITGGCSQGQYVSAINADGSIICNDAIDQSAQGVCQSSNGSPGVIFNNVCILDYDNTQSTDWNTAVTSCSALGGDLCSASQYVAMTTNGGTFNTDLFYSGRPRWTQDFSDNDSNSKGVFLHSSDDPSLIQQYSYACCGNVLPEPTRSNATDINGVKVTYLHDKQDTIWSTASQICHQKNSDLCTKSQLVALNDANAFGSTAVRRASNDLSDNDANLMNDVLGTNSLDNANYLQTFAFACCGLSTKPTDNSCPGTVIAGVCTGTINDANDSNFFDAARTCHAEGANICSKSQMQVLRNNGQFSNACWTSDGADNDSNRGAGVLASQPDNPNPNTDLFGYACCY